MVSLTLTTVIYKKEYSKGHKLIGKIVIWFDTQLESETSYLM